MEVAENHIDYKTEYQMKFYNKVQGLTEKRKSLHISQSEIARISGCSLRKVQMFESYKSMDAYLLFIYKKITNNEQISN